MPAELPEFSAIACSNCAGARLQNHIRAVHIDSACASVSNIGLSGCGRHLAGAPSAAVKHISSEAEMPPTSMNDGLSLTAPAQAPQRKTNHAAGTPAILAAVMSLSFAAPCATTPVPATRKLRRRIGEWPRRAAIASEAAARIDRSRETVCASHRIAGCWGCPAQTKPESCTHTHIQLHCASISPSSLHQGP